ncbi:glycosyltransferase family 2 protein [Betaproteobacteria bacterium]|nr:glycosyltransferase family 2 protein [Betaproteobacteria bacterium]
MIKLVSIIIPVFNEVDAIEKLVENTQNLRNLGLNFDYEIIIVDDGSTDGTGATLKEMQLTNQNLDVVSLVRNYGQSTALQAGFDHSTGDVLITMDGDLQNDPADIPKIIDVLKNNNEIDLVAGWRKDRQDSVLNRKLPSMFANYLISYTTGIKLRDYGCSLKGYRRELVSKFRLYGEMHRFIPAIAAEVGAKIIEIPVKHHPRKTGKSKYGIDRTLRVILDLIWIQFSRRYMHRPIHAFGGIGLTMLSAGLLIFLWLFFEKVFLGSEIGTRPLLTLGLLLTLLGTQLLAVGLLGELLIRIYHEPSGRKQYQVKLKK